MNSMKSAYRWKIALSILTFILLSATAAWAQTYKVLHSFGSPGDGDAPYAGLVFDNSGNLYGTAASGGTSNNGVVFQLMPNPGGGWTET